MLRQYITISKFLSPLALNCPWKAKKCLYEI